MGTLRTNAMYALMAPIARASRSLTFLLDLNVCSLFIGVPVQTRRLLLSGLASQSFPVQLNLIVYSSVPSVTGYPYTVAASSHQPGHWYLFPLNLTVCS